MTQEKIEQWEKKLKEMKAENLHGLILGCIASLINTGTATNPVGGKEEILRLALNESLRRLKLLERLETTKLQTTPIPPGLIVSVNER